MNPYRNPVHLVGVDRSPALVRLLRSCGTEESCITGRASDYEKFAALAAVLPLCTGHPEAARVQNILTQATGLTAPLCLHTAPAYWRAWVNAYWYEREEALPALPDLCPLCDPAEPAAWGDLAPLPDPTAIPAANLGDWSHALEAALAQGGIHPLMVLPDDYTFVRPDPYHANLAVGKLSAGEPLTAEERDLLLTQALRVWGLSLVRDPQLGEKTLLLYGGIPAEVTRLLAYLAASKTLPTIVWIPRDPADAGEISGLYPTVGTGYALPDDCTPAEEEAIRAAYAAVAPVGRAVVVIG